MERALAQRMRVICLFDAYGRLLTTRQQRLLRFYYLDDLSLGEIAQRLEITRQAVFDSLRRSVGELQRLENSLRVVNSRHQAARHQLQVTERLEALEQALDRLQGQVEQKTLHLITDELAALRRVLF